MSPNKFEEPRFVLAAFANAEYKYDWEVLMNIINNLRRHIFEATFFPIIFLKSGYDLIGAMHGDKKSCTLSSYNLLITMGRKR